MSKFIEKSDNVFDCFLGSGTSAIAAHLLDCNFVGCELDKDYYDAACERFKLATAQGAMDI